MARLFGTDGVRGIANQNLNCELAYKLAQASAALLTNEAHKARILIGKDTRISGDMLESSLVAGICSAGAEAVVLGVIPTSAVAHLTRQYNADAGIVISASHNPAEYNGIKIFNSNGYKLADSLEDKIEKFASEGYPFLLPTGVEIGRRVEAGNALKDYEDFLVSTSTCMLSGLKVVVDTANGAASAIAPQVFERLGAEVFSFFNMPDGTNINARCGSTHPEQLQKLVQQTGADVGLAFDGDADRLIAVDHLGNIVDGDKILALCATDLNERGMLRKNTVVATVMSNLGLELYLKEHEIYTEKTNVGDRYVLEKMLAEGFNFGGEQSGHIIFLDHNTTGDGILTGIQLLGVLKRKQKSLAALVSDIKILPQVLVNARVYEENKYAYREDKQINEEIAMLEKTMAGRGRVLIRTSGTEPLVRVMIEGENRESIEKEAVAIANLIETRLA
jgi:phosphoglucosamine mutase